MPNHCETDFYISGPKALVESIVAKHFKADGTLDCDSVIPYPEFFKIKDQVARDWEKENCQPNCRYVVKEGVDPMKRPVDGFNQGGYEWCCENWGTKWGTYSRYGETNQPVTLEFENGLIEWQTTFDSAWGPPEPVFAKLAEMYPEVYIHTASYECGMGYEFIQDYEKGVLTFQQENPYHGERGG